MSVVDAAMADTVITMLEARRSTRRLVPGSFPPALVESLASATSLIPSSFNTQPWHVLVLCERNTEFWDLVTETIEARLDGDRRDRYLGRARDLREGGMTLLIFEDLDLSGPNEYISTAEAREYASQAFGMLQLSLWLILIAHGLATSLQHWHFLLGDVALTFASLPDEGYRLVAFMPVGYPAESPGPRQENGDRLTLECFQAGSPVNQTRLASQPRHERHAWAEGPVILNERGDEEVKWR